MKTVEKLGNGEKTIEAVDRIDSSNVVFGVAFRRIMSYSSRMEGKSSTIIHCVDFVCLGVSNEFTNEQTIYGSFEQEFGIHVCSASLTYSSHRSVSQRVETSRNILPVRSSNSSIHFVHE